MDFVLTSELGCHVFVFPEEFRKKQGKSHLSSNLLYFLGTGFRATDSDTMKVRDSLTVQI